MPTLFIEGYKFRFYSSDVHEPPHVHDIHGERMAKVWLQPLEIESNYGYNSSELNRILKLTQANQQRLLEAWNEYFNQ